MLANYNRGVSFKKPLAFGARGFFILFEPGGAMVTSRGVTLIELIVVLVIAGVGATIAIPNYINTVEQTKAQEARNNLFAVSAAQQKYYENYGAYCTATTGNTVPCGNSKTNLNANLRLSISDDFNYSCSVSGGSYTCTASDGTDTLTLDPTTTSFITCSPFGPTCPS